MSLKEYYERYWQADTPPPAGDPTTAERKHLLAEALHRFADGASPFRILDAGCGDGEFFEFFQGQGFQVWGCDVAEAAVTRAQQLHPGIPVQAASLEETLPFPPGHFSAVWCTEVLEHLFDVSRALAEFHRVLRPAGLLILTTPFHGRLKMIATALLPGRFEAHFDVNGPHIRFFSRKSLAASLARAGFEAVGWRGTGRFWPFYRSFFVVARKK